MTPMDFADRGIVTPATFLTHSMFDNTAIYAAITRLR
jgi:hypothetical protein